MNADREPNRLPLRAGAMLLLAVAVVFIGLGWNSAAKSDDETPQEKLANNPAQTTSVTSESTAPSGTEPAGSPTSTPADAADVPKLCVLNAGSTKGLAKQVSDQLQSEGFTIGTEPGNLSTSSVTENTIFYGEGEEDAAKKVAESVPGGASLAERPATFTRCAGELVVVVVTS